MTTAKKNGIKKLTTVLGGVEPTREEVGLRAYFIWEREGKPQGREQQHWLQALAELKAERDKAIKPPVKTKPAAAPKRKVAAPAKTKPKAKKK